MAKQLGANVSLWRTITVPSGIMLLTLEMTPADPCRHSASGISTLLRVPPVDSSENCGPLIIVCRMARWNVSTEFSNI